MPSHPYQQAQLTLNTYFHIISRQVDIPESPPILCGPPGSRRACSIYHNTTVYGRDVLSSDRAVRSKCRTRKLLSSTTRDEAVVPTTKQTQKVTERNTKLTMQASGNFFAVKQRRNYLNRWRTIIDNRLARFYGSH